MIVTIRGGGTFTTWSALRTRLREYLMDQIALKHNVPDLRAVTCELEAPPRSKAEADASAAIKLFVESGEFAALSTFLTINNPFSASQDAPVLP